MSFVFENERFPYQRLSTYRRFETEARGNSEMAYSCTIQVFPHTICFQNPAQFQFFSHTLSEALCMWSMYPIFSLWLRVLQFDCVLHDCFKFSLAIYKTLIGQDDSIYLQQSCLTLF